MGVFVHGVLCEMVIYAIASPLIPPVVFFALYVKGLSASLLRALFALVTSEAIALGFAVWAVKIASVAKE